MTLPTYLSTISNRRIDLLDPDPGMIVLSDIAYALARVPRFGGHTCLPWSVAEHCILVSKLVAEPYKLQALLHDATEAYICDIPSPLKNLLGTTYRDIETRLATAIGKKFGCDLVNLSVPVKHGDLVALMSEHEFFQPNVQWDYDLAGGLRTPISFSARKVHDIQEEFTELVLYHGGTER